MNVTTIFLPIRAIMARQTITVSSRERRKKWKGGRGEKREL